MWPEYNLHGAVLNSYWNRNFDDFPDFQFALFDDERGEVLAEGHTLPCPWDGTTEGLGDGIDAITVAAFEAAAVGSRADRAVRDGRRGQPALSGKRPGRPGARSDVAGRARGRSRLSDRAGPAELQGPLPDHADRALRGLDAGDGEPFDPWIRIHTRRGGRIVKPIPAVASDHGHRRRMGAVDRHEVPGVGRVRRSRPGSRRSTSTARRMSGPTGSRTCGSSTRSADAQLAAVAQSARGSGSGVSRRSICVAPGLEPRRQDDLACRAPRPGRRR